MAVRKVAEEIIEGIGRLLPKQFDLPKKTLKPRDAVKKEEKLDKPLSKTAREEQERAARIEAQKLTIRRRGLQPGQNVMPFVNPSEEELAKIRTEKGGSTMPVTLRNKPVDLSQLTPAERLKYSKKDIFDPGAVGNLLDPLPKKRPKPKAGSQFDLPRKQPAPVGSPRGAVSGHVSEIVGNKAVRAQLLDTIRKGLKMGAGNWYDTAPLRKAFVTELGPQEGEAAFNQFVKMLGPTSALSDVAGNIRQASNYYSQARSGRTDPFVLKRSGLESYEVPPPDYGSTAQQNMMENVDKLREGGGLSSIDNPKIASFIQNLLGNWNPATIDRHAMRLMGMLTKDPRWLKQGPLSKTDPFNPAAEVAAGRLSMDEAAANQMYWQEAPDPKDYGALEQMWIEMAKEAGVSPAEAQAAAWIGGGQTTGVQSEGLSFIDVLKDRIRRTSIRDNVPPDEVLRRFIRGEMTLAELTGPDDGTQIG